VKLFENLTSIKVSDLYSLSCKSMANLARKTYEYNLIPKTMCVK